MAEYYFENRKDRSLKAYLKIGESIESSFLLTFELTDAIPQNVVKGSEGCLSIPNYRGVVPRADSIIVSYFDFQTKQFKKDTVGGYTAIIFQHETDHLEGILYTDRADTVFFNQAWADERKLYEQQGAYTKPSWWPY